MRPRVPASTRPFFPEDCEPDGDPAEFCDEEGETHEEFIDYSGEPSLMFRAGIGLRVGLP